MLKASDRRFARLQIFSLLSMAAVASLIFYANQDFYHDDAYITLRYARNFLSGHGIVWNPGEYVQGYTNFLFLMAVSLLGALGIDLLLASRALGLLALLALVFGLMWYQQRRSAIGEYHPLDMLPVFLIGTAAPMVVWSIGGLEGTLFTLLVSAATLLFLSSLRTPLPARRLSASGFLFAAAFLTRPDGAVFVVAAAIGWLFVVPERRIRQLAGFLLPCLVMLLPYVAWQFWYYGDVVPNTFYAKAGIPSLQKITAGLRYVGEYALSPPFSLLLLFPVLFFVTMRRMLDAQMKILSLMILSYLLFVIYAGGDHMTAFRLMLPLIPATAYLLYLLVKACGLPEGKVPVTTIYLLALLLAGMQLLSLRLNPLSESGGSRQGTIVGKYIRDYWPEGSLVALHTAGSTPYFAPNHRYIDMLGLNDKHIARRKVRRLELPWQEEPGHAKGDGAYVLSRQPDYIILGPSRGTLVTDPWFLSDLELQRDRRFGENYQLVQVQLTDDGEPTSEPGLLFTYYERATTGKVR